MIGSEGARTIPARNLENNDRRVATRVTNFRGVSHHVSHRVSHHASHWHGDGLISIRGFGTNATDPGVEPKLHALFDGPLGASLDSVLAALRIPPQFGHGGAGPEYLCATLGVIVVLVVGYIWRRRSLSQAALEASERHAKASAE